MANILPHIRVFLRQMAEAEPLGVDDTKLNRLSMSCLSELNILGYVYFSLDDMRWHLTDTGRQAANNLPQLPN